MSGGDPKDCLYHVWAFVRLAPGAPALTEICLACGVHRMFWEANLHMGAWHMEKEIEKCRQPQ